MYNQRQIKMTEKKKLLVLCVALFCFIAVSAQQRMSVSSPDGKLRFSLKVTSESVSYDIDYRKQPLITNSLLGFSFDSGEFGRNLKAGKVQRKKIDETYKLIVGKTSSVRSRCNEMTVPMQERSDSGRLINLVVRAFDDGIAFRYEFPEQKAWDSYVMYDERTQFNLQGNPMALLMYLPGYVNTHEGVYSHVRYDKVARKRLIEMPATFEFDNGVAVAITEAAIRDYAGMYLMKEKGGLTGKLSPKLGQEKIKVETDSFPHRTPWRVISVADRVGGLLETNILTSLNEPCRIEDTSWIKPCRTRSHGGTGMSCQTAPSLRETTSIQTSTTSILQHAMAWMHMESTDMRRLLGTMMTTSISDGRDPMRTLQNRYRA